MSYYSSHIPVVICAIPRVFVESNTQRTVSVFIYLGSTVTNYAKLDKEIESWIGKANSAFGKLYKWFWNTHAVTIKTKIDIYLAIVL